MTSARVNGHEDDDGAGGGGGGSVHAWERLFSTAAAEEKQGIYFTEM
jgi:hypothetical protein